MRYIKIGEAKPVSVALAFKPCIETELLITTITDQVARAKRDLTDRFKKLLLEKQIQVFQLQMIALNGVLNCYGQKENQNERRKAYLQLIYQASQFAYRLEVLRKQGVDDSQLTTIDPKMLGFFREAITFSNRRPCRTTLCPVTPGALDHITFEDIHARLRRALRLIERNRLANLADNLLRRTVRSGKGKQAFIVKGRENPELVRRHLRQLRDLRSACQPN